jgi:hypothetical protein
VAYKDRRILKHNLMQPLRKPGWRGLAPRV